MVRKQVSDAQLEVALGELAGWRLEAGKLHKEYRFPTFAAAMGWMVSVAIYADKIDHHPEWFNVYNRVRVDLVTHDLGNVISDLDLDLATKMESLAQGMV